jgi:anti-sigma factor RsiW
MRVRGTAPHTLVGAYAVDALDHAERARFERHLTRCDVCAQEVRGLREAAAKLGSVAADPPPRRLRTVVLAAAARTRQQAPAGAAITRRAGLARAWLPRAALAALAVSLAGAIVLGVTALGAQHRLSRADERNRQVAAVLTARDVNMMTVDVATGGRATVVVSRARQMIVFSARDLRTLPSAMSYELWLMGPSGVRPAGMLPRPSHGMTAPIVAAGVAAGDRIGLTVEPDGGSARPTSAPVLMAALPS